MNLNILISTVDNKFLTRTTEIDSSTIIINQLISTDKCSVDSENVFSFYEKGLSKSRNKAIEFCNSDIALISDDDVEYIENLEEIIVKAFEENPSIDIITFQIKTPDGGLFKTNYQDFEFIHNMKSIMKVSSIEIAFKTNSIKKSNLKFDEKFGLGTNYPTGEEAIFLSDALKRGLKIKYIPITIVFHPKESSGGMFKDNPKLISAKGAMLYRIFGICGYLVAFIFAIKKYKISNYKLFTFFAYMLEGISKYKKEISNEL
ncbi:glycosyltransferase [Aliarcobacter cryaerophilus]|uniref:glycosyltransferase n=1 Tax=Aliarcobacter cryaerophilus TaxID=28198 RepID=UPI0021B5BE72|nr:glycosyltransferase [Aliarcobacter cryaerophilus]MCT7492529.1 glycosyltransferase [Aliarcobacter cryaerophilus]